MDRRLAYCLVQKTKCPNFPIFSQQQPLVSSDRISNSMFCVDNNRIYINEEGGGILLPNVRLLRTKKSIAGIRMVRTGNHGIIRKIVTPNMPPVGVRLN